MTIPAPTRAQVREVDRRAIDDFGMSGLVLMEYAGSACVDVLLGTAAAGSPRRPFDAAIRQMNAARAKRLAVDLPSGLDCDTGGPAEPTFRADHTCTFVATKIGFANPRAAEFLGQIHVLDIGAPRILVEQIAIE